MLEVEPSSSLHPHITCSFSWLISLVTVTLRQALLFCSIFLFHCIEPFFFHMSFQGSLADIFFRGIELSKDAHGIASLVGLLSFFFFYIMHIMVVSYYFFFMISQILEVLILRVIADWDVTPVCSICSSICSSYNSCSYWITLLRCHRSKRWVVLVCVFIEK